MALYERIAGFYDEIFPLKQARLDFLDSVLGEKAGNVLDIGCASGELALALAKKGFHVCGIDLDETMIAVAGGKAAKHGVKIDFFCRDMLNVGEDFAPGSFAAVLCFGNTLAHLESLGKIADFLKGVHYILKSGGVVVLQVVNFSRVLAGEMKELPLLESENFMFRRLYDYDAVNHRVGFQTFLTIKRSGEVMENKEYLYPLTHGELERLLVSGGFTGLRFWGNESMIPYALTGPALVAAAIKS